MNPIRVVSSMPGSGKTTWVFQHIRERGDERWIFIAPYLKESGGWDSEKEIQHKGRIKEELPEMNFKNPSPSKTSGKKEDFKKLLNNGENISATHQLWTVLDSGCAELISFMGYNIVIDESLDLIQTYEEVDQMDLRLAIQGGMIKPSNGTSQLEWNYDKFSGNYSGAFKEIKHLCDIGALFLYGDEVVIHKVPPQLIMSAQQVIVLTYGFPFTTMGAWCEMDGIDYYIDDSVELYKSNEQIREELKERLNVIDIPRTMVDVYEKYSSPMFTKGWYEKYFDQEKDVIKRAINNVVKKKMDNGNIFWTTFKDYKTQLQGRRYTNSKMITLDGETWRREPFIAKNMRASNEYRDCTNCIYLVDVRMNPYIKNYMIKHGAVSLDEDKYALLEMLQFIFRGCVRNQSDDEHYSNHMNVFVGSVRMQILLKKWLSGELIIH